VFLSKRTEADFQAWRDERDWTERKYAQQDQQGKKVNPEPSADDNGDDPRAAVSSMHVTMEEQSEMARPRERVCLEQGLKLDLVQLARRGFIQFGANVGPRNPME